MSLINDVLRDIDRRQGSRPTLPAGDAQLMVAPPARTRRWPPSWLLLLGVGLAVGAIGGHLLYGQFAAGERNTDNARGPVAGQATDIPPPTQAPPQTSAAPETVGTGAPALDEPTTTGDEAVQAETPGEAAGARVALADLAADETDAGQEHVAPPLTPEVIVAKPDTDTETPPTPPTPSAPPAPEATASPQQTVFLPPGTRVNLRALPDLNADVLRILSDRNELTLLENGDIFRRVRTADGVTGWISSRYSSLAPYATTPLDDPRPAEPVRTPAEAPQRVASRPSQDSYRNALRALERGDMASAEAGLRQALADKPGDLAPLDALAALMLRQNRAPELRILLADLHGAGIAHATHLLARLQAEGGDTGGAIALLDSLPPEKLGDIGLATLAALHQRAGDHALAATTYRQALSLGNRAASTWAGLAISLETLGQLADARQAWEATLAADPSDPALAEHARRRLATLVGTGD